MFYVIDENHNMIEAYDKEGVLAVLAQAIADGSLSGITADSAFVSQLKCCVSGQANKVAFVTQAKYNELKASNMLLSNCLYFVIDDTTADDIDRILSELSEKMTSILCGGTAVPKATHAITADSSPCLKDANRKFIMYTAWDSLTLGEEFELGCVYALRYSPSTVGMNYEYCGIIVVPNINSSYRTSISTMLGKDYRLAMTIDKDNYLVSVSVFDEDGNAVKDGGLEIVKIAEFGY